MEKNEQLMEKIVSLCKRRGFVFQGSEIYGGLAGTWDYGPLGVALKNNIKRLWWKRFVDEREDIYGLDAAILMNEKVWEASGHTETFSDPLVECLKCKRRFRADQILPNFKQDIKVEKTTEGLNGKEESYTYDASINGEVKCFACGGELDVAGIRQFNLMFETRVGAQGDMRSYLRPETAQGIFMNFKNVVDSMHPKLPFGIAQTGKAFRNEIAPREFLFRTREFEQMEIEYFIRESEWENQFEKWRTDIKQWLADVGLPEERLRELEVSEEDLAHYSKRTIDFEYKYPGKGFGELLGLAYRTDFDLKNHQEVSGTELSYLDPETNERFVPHVIEPSFGLDRLVFALLAEAYREDELGGEKRTYLAFKPGIAPVDVAVFPLLKNKPDLVQKAREVYEKLKPESSNLKAVFDDNGNIGKRYRRQDEIGTPFCITIDFDTLEDDTVTVRDRDTGEQKRVPISELSAHIRS